jgi:di/tripeptidase
MKYPKINAASIGFEIHNAHTPNECILVKSVKDSYKLICKLLTHLK